jgi:hypothetical protein
MIVCSVKTSVSMSFAMSVGDIPGTEVWITTHPLTHSPTHPLLRPVVTIKQEALMLILEVVTNES